MAQLIAAVKLEDEELVLSLLRANADPDAEDGWDRQTPLCAAAEVGNTAVMKILLESKADVNKQKMFYDTPLTVAIKAGREEAALLLIHSGAHCLEEGQNGETPIYFAARTGLTSVVNRLLSQGADADQANWDSRTPLHEASREGHELVISALLAAKADPNEVDSQGRTALMEAAACADLSVVSLLLNAKANVNEEDKGGLRSLHYAAAIGSPSTVRMLLEHKADPTAADQAGRKPANTARGAARSTVIALLDAAARGDSFNDAMASATSTSPSAASRNLSSDTFSSHCLDQSADDNSSGNGNDSSISSSSNNTAAEMSMRARASLIKVGYVGSLLAEEEQNSAHRRAANKGDASSSSEASHSGTEDLDGNGEGEGDRRRVSIPEGNSALGSSSSSSSSSVSVGRGATESESEHAASRRASLRSVTGSDTGAGTENEANGEENDAEDDGDDAAVAMEALVSVLQAIGVSDKDTAERLISLGAPVDGFDEDGISPVCLAAELGNSDMISMLLTCGADPNLCSYKNGQSPLMLACAGSHNRAVRVLLERGAHIGAKCHNLRTPLHYAAQACSASCTKLLLRFKADPNIQDMYDNTALLVACEVGATDVALALLDSGADPTVCNEDEASPLDFARDNGFPELAALLEDRLAQRASNSTTSAATLPSAQSCPTSASAAM